MLHGVADGPVFLRNLQSPCEVWKLYLVASLKKKETMKTVRSFDGHVTVHRRHCVRYRTNQMWQYMKVIDSTCFGHQHAYHQEYKQWIPHLVTNPGKRPQLHSAGLLDVCAARRMWPNPLSSAHIKQSSDMRPRRLSRVGHQMQWSLSVLLMMGMLIPETCWVN
jgi:hypothetical protein